MTGSFISRFELRFAIFLKVKLVTNWRIYLQVKHKLTLLFSGNAADASFWTIGDTVQIEINQPAGLTGVLVSLESCLSYSDDGYSADENYITHSTCVNNHISARIEENNAVRFDAFMYQNAATNNTFLECNIQVCVSSDGENADLADCANLITANADSALLNAAANNLTCQ